MEFSPGDPSEVFDLICEDFRFRKSIRPFSKELVLGVCERREELDRMIGVASRNWRLERMSRLDKCILRLAAFEISSTNDIPPKVSIDEAVELGKKFGTHESGSFINGVLDNIFNRLKDGARLKKEVEF